MTDHEYLEYIRCEMHATLVELEKTRGRGSKLRRDALKAEYHALGAEHRRIISAACPDINKRVAWLQEGVRAA